MTDQRYYVYVLSTGEGHFFIGLTTAIRQVMEERRYAAVPQESEPAPRLVYYEGYDTQDRARSRKHYFEQLSGDDLHSLIHSKNPLWKDLSQNW